MAVQTPVDPLLQWVENQGVAIGMLIWFLWRLDRVLQRLDVRLQQLVDAILPEQSNDGKATRIPS